jgi:hypothetical protein
MQNCARGPWLQQNASQVENVLEYLNKLRTQADQSADTH